MDRERSYNLGSLDSVLGPQSGRTIRQPLSARVARAPEEGLWEDFVRSLALVMPGVSQIVRGQLPLGMFYLSSLAFLGSVTWAVLQMIDRLAVTLDLLGLSMYLVVGTLVSIYLMAVTIHLSGVWTATDGSRRRARHPAVSAAASLIVPGWGQILNGDRVRALVFLGGMWLAAGFWIAASAPVTELFNTHLPAVAPWEQLARTPVVQWTARWTLPLVISSLAVYDAAASAIERRS